MPEAMRDKITSLFVETSEVYERGEIIINILKAFQRYYDLLFSAPSSITALWCKESRTINRYVKAITPKGYIYGKAIGLDERGFLRVREEGGKEIILSTAEIIHLRNHG